MKKSNHYEWLIITEGNSDIAVYRDYFADAPVNIRGTRGKDSAINMSAWEYDLVRILYNDLGRIGFKGVIIVVDSDSDGVSPFKDYRRGDDSLYIGDKPTVSQDSTGVFWFLDRLKGLSVLPIKGVNVPRTVPGCLETDLLTTYGFPMKLQPEHDAFVGIIKQATTKWNIPNKGDGEPWWKNNEGAKMDKFMYTALRKGFKVCATKPALPAEPEVIRNIRTAMNS